ncbi:MAG: type II secretion system protein N [Gallionella sp.]|jgi:general secretion pathway protein N
MLRFLIWTVAGSISVLFTLIIFFPVNWIVAIVEQQTGGRLTLGDAQGTLWQGSAFIGGAATGNEALTPLLPGRFSWHLSPMLLLGSVDADLENTAALSQPVSITGSWREWRVSGAAVSVPADRLVALGAPLNTVQPAGQMRLSWEPLQLTQQNGQMEIIGAMNLEMTDLSSRLSPVKPLGSYDVGLEWRGTQATVMLKTLHGPMLLNGSGMINNGRLQFSGTARAEAGQEQRLGNFLNLLGQRSTEGDTDVIALEFK